MLARTPEAALVHEPDNEKEHLAALAAKRGLGRYPVLLPGDAAPAYELLWERALSGAPDPDSQRHRVARQLWLGATQEQREAALHGRLTTKLALALALAGRPEPPARAQRGVHVIVKSVHTPLALEWVAHRFPTARIVVVLRHPANVLSSWRELELPDQDRSLDRHPVLRGRLLSEWKVSPPGKDPLARAAWQVCLLTAALVDAAGRHPEWLVVEHESLCRHPTEEFLALAGQLALAWDDRAAQYLRASNSAGQGFVVRRRAAEQPDRWRSRLTGAEVELLATTMRQFPLLDRWRRDLVALDG